MKLGNRFAECGCWGRMKAREGGSSFARPPRKLTMRTCACGCGAEFRPKRSSHRYASPACVGHAHGWKPTSSHRDRTCGWCGAPFRSSKKAQVYCSLACWDAKRQDYDRHRRVRMRDERENTMSEIPCPCGCGKPVPEGNKYAGQGCSIRYVNAQKSRPTPRPTLVPAVPNTDEPTVPAVVAFLAALPEEEAQALLTVAAVERRRKGVAR